MPGPVCGRNGKEIIYMQESSPVIHRAKLRQKRKNVPIQSYASLSTSLCTSALP